MAQNFDAGCIDVHDVGDHGRKPELTDDLCSMHESGDWQKSISGLRDLFPEVHSQLSIPLRVKDLNISNFV